MREAIAGALDSRVVGPHLSQIADAALSRAVRHGGLEVSYPDGSESQYGDTAPELVIRFNTTGAIADVAVDPMMGLGEAYMSGDIDFEDPSDPQAQPPIDKLAKLMSANGMAEFDRRVGPVLDKLRTRTQPNRRRHHAEQIQTHYDIGNAFYRLWLDDSMTYSCAYFPEEADTVTLEEAQDRKRRHVLNKLRLEPGQRMLDIGSGWGHLAITAATDYGADVLGITLSEEQLWHSREMAQAAGVADRVKFELVDYQDLAEMREFDDEANRFDRVSSVGMFEHVGRGNQADYFQAVDRLLKTGGVTLLHTIAQQRNKPASAWLQRYIFPGGDLPTHALVARYAAAQGFRDPDVESLRRHYARTTHMWWDKFETQLDQVLELFEQGEIQHPLVKSAEEFIRMWRFYLATASGGFEYAHLDLLQFVYTKGIDPSKPMTREHMYPGEQKAA